MGSRGVLSGGLAVHVSGMRVLASFFVLAVLMVMSGLVVVMRRSLMVGSSLMVMLGRRMFGGLRHWDFLPELLSTTPSRRIQGAHQTLGSWQSSSGCW